VDWGTTTTTYTLIQDAMQTPVLGSTNSNVEITDGVVDVSDVEDITIESLLKQLFVGIDADGDDEADEDDSGNGIIADGFGSSIFNDANVSITLKDLEGTALNKAAYNQNCSLIGSGKIVITAADGETQITYWVNEADPLTAAEVQSTAADLIEENTKTGKDWAGWNAGQLAGVQAAVAALTDDDVESLTDDEAVAEALEKIADEIAEAQDSAIAALQTAAAGHLNDSTVKALVNEAATKIAAEYDTDNDDAIAKLQTEYEAKIQKAIAQAALAELGVESVKAGDLAEALGDDATEFEGIEAYVCDDLTATTSDGTIKVSGTVSKAQQFASSNTPIPGFGGTFADYLPDSVQSTRVTFFAVKIGEDVAIIIVGNVHDDTVTVTLGEEGSAVNYTIDISGITFA
jgi:hypothetical protein